jgi:hypothetical protein
MQVDEEIIDIPDEDYSRFESWLERLLDSRGMIAEADFLDRKEIKRLKKIINKKFFKKADLISMLDEYENQKSIQEIKHAKTELKQSNRVGSLAWWKARREKTEPEVAITAPEEQKLIAPAEEQS